MTIRKLLHEQLVEHFDEGEVQDLCFYLDIDYESLEGQGKSNKLRALILYCERHGRTDELVRLAREQRPQVAWPALEPGGALPSRPAMPSPDEMTVRREEAAARIRAIAENLSALGDGAGEPGASPASELDEHYRIVVRALMEGRVVPFLGGGVNLSGRPAGASWKQGQYWPTSRELALYLAEKFRFPAAEQGSLVRVSQYLALMARDGLLQLYEELREVLEGDYPATPLHRFFAALPAARRAAGYFRGYRLILSTNYDDGLERAFRQAGEPFDVVAYIAEGSQAGKFVHRPPGEQPRVIDSNNEYKLLAPEQRTVILKIRGLVEEVNSDFDSYVITEDHLIDFLSRARGVSPVPTLLLEVLRNNHLLFLGYDLRHWSRRAVLHRLWPDGKSGVGKWRWWVVQSDVEPLDAGLCRVWGLDPIGVSQDEYIAQLSRRIAALVLRGRQRE